MQQIIFKCWFQLLLFLQIRFALTLFIEIINLRLWSIFYSATSFINFHNLWCLLNFSLYCATGRKDPPNFSMKRKGVGFLIVWVQNKQETGSGVITNCFEEEQKLLLLHSSPLLNRIGPKRYWVRETEPKGDDNSKWQMVRVILAGSYLGPSHWPFKRVTWSKLLIGVTKYAF